MHVLEYFSLRQAEAAAKDVGDDARRQALRARVVAMRGAMAADTLWAAGHRAEALRLACGAFDAGLEGLAGLGDLRERAMPQAEVDRLRAIVAPARESAGVGTDPFPVVQSANRRLERALEPWGRAPADVRRLRSARIGAVAGSLVAAVIAIVWLFSPGDRVWATASAYRTFETVETWPPENVLDRDEQTYWHLPPGELGWLDLHFEPARDVRALRIMNAHDMHVQDRQRFDRRPFGHSSRRIVVHVFAGGREIASSEHTLARVTRFEQVTIELDAKSVERIRIEVTEFSGNGGGLAEVEVLE